MIEIISALIIFAGFFILAWEVNSLTNSLSSKISMFDLGYKAGRRAGFIEGFKNDD